MSRGFFDQRSPDEDAELAFTIKPEISQSPRVGSPRNRLQLVDNLHRPELRRAGNAAAGKTGSQGGKVRCTRPQTALDGGHQVLDLRVAFETHQLRNVDPAELANLAEIVSEQVSDHHQLGHFLCAGL